MPGSEPGHGGEEGDSFYTEIELVVADLRPKLKRMERIAHQAHNISGKHDIVFSPQTL